MKKTHKCSAFKKSGGLRRPVVVHLVVNGLWTYCSRLSGDTFCTNNPNLVGCKNCLRSYRAERKP